MKRDVGEKNFKKRKNRLRGNENSVDSFSPDLFFKEMVEK